MLVKMNWVGVHIISTGTSWINSFSTGISSTNCSSCTAKSENQNNEAIIRKKEKEGEGGGEDNKSDGHIYELGRTTQLPGLIFLVL